MKSERLLLLGIILSMCIWGISWSSAKVLSGYGHALSIAFIRFTFTIIVLAIILLVTKQKLTIKKKGIGYVTSAGLFMFLYAYLFFSGIQMGKPGAAGVLVTIMNPIFAFIIGALINKIYPKKSDWIGLFIGLCAGAILLQFWKNVETIFAAGNSLFLIAAAIWAIMSKVSSHAYKFGNSISFSMWIHIVALIGLGISADFSETWRILSHGDSTFWWNMMYFSIINSALATTCFLYAAAKIGAEKASTFVFIVPAMAVLAAWVFMGEEILWNTVLGGLLGVLAVFIINRKSPSKDTIKKAT